MSRGALSRRYATCGPRLKVRPPVSRSREAKIGACTTKSLVTMCMATALACASWALRGVRWLAGQLVASWRRRAAAGMLGRVSSDTRSCDWAQVPDLPWVEVDVALVGCRRQGSGEIS